MRSGWAIPISTDIVLAMGILALMGSAAPAGAKALLAGVAVFDDLGAIVSGAFAVDGDLGVCGEREREGENGNDAEELHGLPLSMRWRKCAGGAAWRPAGTKDGCPRP